MRIEKSSNRYNSKYYCYKKYFLNNRSATPSKEELQEVAMENEK